MLFLIQATEQISAFREFMQYVGNAAAVGAFVFAWRTNGRVIRLETVMSEPEIGVVPNVSHLRKNSHTVNNTLHEHGVRLDGHDTEIGDIKSDRRHQKRRAEDRDEG